MKQTALIMALLTLLAVFVSCTKKKTTEVLPQCAKPVFSLSSGVFAQQDTFTIICDTPQAKIRYTIDGSDPTEESNIYLVPITFSQTRFYKARAYKDGYTPSEIVTARYILNPNTVQMVSVNGGTFNMGRTKNPPPSDFLSPEQNDELPVHAVTLTAFKIGKYETSQPEWNSVMGTSPSVFFSLSTPNLPVENVNWYDAIRYCNIRSIAENLTPVYTIKGKTNPDEWGNTPTYFNTDWDAVICNWDANGYRLPTEAEWEYTARSSVNNPDYIYAGSDSLHHVGWFVDFASTTETVGLKGSNALSIFDMSGNVWEWCWDRRDSGYYAVSPSNNPKGPNTGIHRVLRGGSWKSINTNCRIAERNYSVPYYKENTIGFRVVRNAN
ncbi:MAG: SUMF1/EgtB/PvdO family nonheme iron enzyme [Candidatus Cloacimonetes bacterium]|nr:SUMF1/EgtB/PvdO family nonheme iron enzyme [Candidatus Cloacimonadota bacterium]